MSDEESQDALEHLVENLAVHLNEGERRSFAEQLPSELHDIALSVYATVENSTQDLIEEYMEVQGVAEEQAKNQIRSAWHALKDAISSVQTDRILSQLPRNTVAFLR